jgi:hypothetical protein
VPPAARKRCTAPGCRKLAPAGRKRCDEHKPQRKSAGQSLATKLRGCTEPRLFTPPLRPLTRKTSKGFEVIEFARLIGEPLLPWQEWCVIHALELNPDGSFRFRTVLIIVARQNGKSSLKRIVTLWRMYVDGARNILGVAQDLSLARLQWQMCQDTIRSSPELQAEWRGARNVNGDEMFWAGTGCYAIKAANAKAGRGTSNDEVNIDELRTQRDWDAWGSLSKTTMARPNSQIWAMSNAGDDSSIVLNSLRDGTLSGKSQSSGIFEWSAVPNCELDDPKAWAQANPALGYLIDESSIISALATDPPAVFRTEVLCQRVEQLDAAVDPIAWRDCADPAGTLDAYRGRVAVCLDVAASGHGTLVAAAEIGEGRVRVEVVRAWDSPDAIRADLEALLDKIRAARVAWFPTGPGGQFAPILRKRHGSAELTGTKVAEACQSLAGLVQARQLSHPDDPLLNSHIGAAEKLASGDAGWRFTRRNGDVDAAFAAAGAAYVALTDPPQAPRIRILTS